MQGAFAVPAEYMLKRDLYETLDKNPPIRINDEDLEAFYQAQTDENLGKFEDLQSKLKEVVSNMAAIEEQYENDSLLKEQALQAEYQAKMAELNALVPENTIEQNEKVVAEIYYSTIAKGVYNYTEQQLEDLYLIASQCPFAGGEAVYQARTMIGLSGDQLMYDDQNNCALGFYKTDEEEKLPSANPLEGLQLLNIYPNPATDKVRIEYLLSQDGILTIELHDMLGRIISSQTANSRSNEAIVEVGHIANGLYHLLFTIDGKKVGSEKITVNHR